MMDERTACMHDGNDDEGMVLLLSDKRVLCAAFRIRLLFTIIAVLKMSKCLGFCASTKSKACSLIQNSNYSK